MFYGLICPVLNIYLYLNTILEGFLNCLEHGVETIKENINIILNKGIAFFLFKGKHPTSLCLISQQIESHLVFV